ncbi:MAG: hypothetical protein HUU35_11870 [Armatimonadetes bacterium]|nr:hypothetical protein [Armatimonadota bacterium]
MTIEAIRSRCSDLHVELATAYHRAGAGLSAELDTSGILDRYQDLVDPARVAEVTAASSAADNGRERRRLAMLRDHVAWVYDAYTSRELVDRLQREEAQAEVTVDGETFPYRALAIKLMNEPDRARRERLAAARDAALAGFEPLYLEQFQQTQQIARDLGFANHRERCELLGGLPLEALATAVRELLEATETLYAGLLPAALEPLGVPAAEASWFDFSHLFRVTAFDDWFPAAGLLPRITRMIEALGLDIHAAGRVAFDLEERPLKSPRPFCSVLRVPWEVVLVLRPMGGLSDYAAFLHELGHALHFGYASPELPWEFRHLGDNSITEGYAFLFDRLTVDPDWLSEFAELPEPGPLVHLLALRELMMVRKYSAQLLYELELFERDDPRPLAEAWAARLSRATGVRQSPANYLASVDPMFYSARYLQGWLYEALLNSRLRGEHGPRWYAQPAAGQQLRELYARGQDIEVAGLFTALGAAPLDPQPLLQRTWREFGVG